MTREIKFRAWDKEEKMFVKRVQENRIPTVNTREGFKLKSRFVLQQYAGFRDKYGKPVYEGDIVSWKYQKDSYVFTGEIVFGHHKVGSDSFGFDLHTVGFFIRFKDAGISGIDAPLKYTVIGNIHEHPELLSN